MSISGRQDALPYLEAAAFNLIVLVKSLTPLADGMPGSCQYAGMP